MAALAFGPITGAHRSFSCVATRRMDLLGMDGTSAIAGGVLALVAFYVLSRPRARQWPHSLTQQSRILPGSRARPRSPRILFALIVILCLAVYLFVSTWYIFMDSKYVSNVLPFGISCTIDAKGVPHIDPNSPL